MSGLNVCLRYEIGNGTEVETYRELVNKLAGILHENGLMVWHMDGLHDFPNHRFNITIYSSLRPTILPTLRMLFRLRRNRRHETEQEANPERAYKSLNAHLAEFGRSHGESKYKSIWVG